MLKIPVPFGTSALRQIFGRTQADRELRHLKVISTGRLYDCYSIDKLDDILLNIL